MYTLQPLAAWNHFQQASTFYEMHLRISRRTLNEVRHSFTPEHLDSHNRAQRRLEQSLYWSCFKSEIEFRVELNLPQSTIADLEHPDLFPSPPTPEETDRLTGQSPSSLHRFVDLNYGFGVRGLRMQDSVEGEQDDATDVRFFSKRLGNEEESWYYYLTEVALRRIGNRVINTFYQQPPQAWLEIERFIPAALELETQVSSWSATLPSAMQHNETSPRAVMDGSLFSDAIASTLRELSWATDNRLLEMKAWLYQPFLFYSIHRSAIDADKQDSRLEALIQSGVESNLKIIEVRTLRHRHHGLWYDLRAIVAASLILMAVIRSGRLAASTMFGDEPPTTSSLTEAPGRDRSKSRLENVIAALDFWSEESPDLIRARQVLEEVAVETRHIVATSV